LQRVAPQREAFYNIKSSSHINSFGLMEKADKIIYITCFDQPTFLMLKCLFLW